MTIETSAVIKEIISRTHDVKSFRIIPERFVDFKAGQWLFVKITEAGNEFSKPLSISSSPTEEGYLEFTKKITSSEFSKALEQLKPGDKVGIKYPLGSFVFENNAPKIAFLSGGIGITPIRSICREITDRRWSTDVVLVYGNNTLDDIAFREDLGLLKAQNPRMKVVDIVCRNCGDWCGRTGFITADVVRDEIPDYTERRFYVCGPPVMVEIMKKILLNELSLSREQLITENFAGYE